MKRSATHFTVYTIWAPYVLNYLPHSFGKRGSFVVYRYCRGSVGNSDEVNIIDNMTVIHDKDLVSIICEREMLQLKICLIGMHQWIPSKHTYLERKVAFSLIVLGMKTTFGLDHNVSIHLK